MLLFHTHCTHTHTCRNKPVLGTDPHFSLRQFACLASEWTCLTSHVYMMTNPTFNLLCLFAARTNFFYLINDHALKATKCWMNHYTRSKTPSVTANGCVSVCVFASVHVWVCVRSVSGVDACVVVGSSVCIREFIFLFVCLSWASPGGMRSPQ